MLSVLRSILFVAPMLLGASRPASVFAAPSANITQLHKIAVVDVQRCILETHQGKKAKKELEDTLSKGEAKLGRKQSDLKKQVDDLRAKAAMLARDELMRRQQDLMRKESELQELYTQLQEEIGQKEALLAEQIYKNVASVVQQVALEERLQVVLVRSQASVLYANPQLDLTNRVIVLYDKKFK